MTTRRLATRAAGLVVATLVASLQIPASATDTNTDGGDANRIPAPPPRTSTDLGAPSAVPGELIVTFAPGVSSAARRSIAARIDGRVVPQERTGPVSLVRIPTTADPVAASARVQSMRAVEVAEPNWVLEPLEVIPDDPGFGSQWGLRNVGQSHPIADPPPSSVTGLSGADASVSDAWDVTQGSDTTVVAVIDTGVWLTHPDLDDNIWTNPGETPANGIDDDGNGFVDDVHGWDFFDDDDTPVDEHGHGTHVAGIIAAEANNTTGGAGVCPLCTIMPVRAGDGTFTTFDIIQAINYAVTNDADIINMSIGGPAWSKQERTAIAAAIAQGVLVVAAAGNNARNNDWLWWTADGPVGPTYPASFDLDGLLAVAASNDYDEFGYRTGCVIRGGGSECFFTNYGRVSVDLAAPGVDIYSTWVDDGYVTVNGTSMASPFAAGVAGLVKSEHPSYTPTQLKAALLHSVDLPTQLGGRYLATNGRINAEEALSETDLTGTVPGDGTIRGAVGIRMRKAGSLAWPSDVNDVFKKRLRKGRTYRVGLIVPRRGDFDLFVWRPGTLDIWPTDYGCGKRLGCAQVKVGVRAGKDKDETVTFTARTSGVYYVLVSDYRGAGGYTLSVRRI